MLVASSNITKNNANAQNESCPNGKTMFLWINGILVPTEEQWATTVNNIGSNFLRSQNLSSNCIRFNSAYNHSAWILTDLEQAAGQLAALALGRINFADPDFVSLLDKIGGYSVQGYKVVLVGHSQGTLYTNLAYEAIRNGEAQIYVPTIRSLPDKDRLSIINIATPASYVADPAVRYTTQCGDIILTVPYSLRANINNTHHACSVQGPLTSKHRLEAYLTSGSETQEQIYRHLIESLATTPLVLAPLTATCSADPAVITAGESTTFRGTSSGGTGIRRGSWSGVVYGRGSTATYRTSTSTSPGFGKATYTVTDSGSPRQVAIANCQVQIKAPVAATGTIVITTNGTVPSVKCKLNGVSVTGPGTFNNQPVGSKTLSCAAPTGFTLTSITPSTTQTLVAGGTISFKVSLESPTPVLTKVLHQPSGAVRTVTLTGTGFVPGMQVYTCTSTLKSSCTSKTFTLVNSTSVVFTIPQPTNSTWRLYARVTNSAGTWSNYLSFGSIIITTL